MDDLLDAGPFADLLSLNDAAKTYGIDSSTIRKAIASGRLVYGTDVCKFGKQWVITKNAMRKCFGGHYLKKMYKELSGLEGFQNGKDIE